VDVDVILVVDLDVVLVLDAVVVAVVLLYAPETPALPKRSSCSASASASSASRESVQGPRDVLERMVSMLTG